ncbi:MAG: hypothetical protein KW806_02930, partial [Candidatus Yanofskybacteria bacterium]|nr:hypothetical protein [Candidatus Yanofskybacteria bacterium]
MAWREEYPTKKGTRYRIRWREDGKRHHKAAGQFALTANKIIRNVEDDLLLGKTHRIERTVKY